MNSVKVGSTQFKHNVDLSGHVFIETENGEGMWVPGRDILAFVAKWARDQRAWELQGRRGTGKELDELHAMKTHQLLGLEKDMMPPKMKGSR